VKDKKRENKKDGAATHEASLSGPMELVPAKKSLVSMANNSHRQNQNSF
jgi:hypothetical protein